MDLAEIICQLGISSKFREMHMMDAELHSRLIEMSGSSVLLRLGPAATNNPRNGVRPESMGNAQAVAFEFGRGRVVILADATMLTAQRVRQRPYEFTLGMSRPDIDNVAFLVNTMRWLARSTAPQNAPSRRTLEHADAHRR